MQTTRQDRQIANLAALAISLSMLDAAIPSPIPGLKPGFANIITMLTLLTHGWQAALWVTMLRVFASGLLLGSLFTPGFWLALAGATASLGSLALTRYLPSRFFSAISHSLLAAQAHLLAQLLVVRLVFITHDNILALALPLSLFALLSGTVNGLVTNRLMRNEQTD